MTLYRIKKIWLFSLLLVLLGCFLFAVFDKTGTLWVIRILGLIGSGVWIVFGFPLELSFRIGIDQDHIVSMYIFPSRPWKIMRNIKWSEVAEITTNAAGMCVVFPRLSEGKKRYRFKDILIIPKTIENYKELTREIIARAENASVHESVQKMVGEWGIAKSK